MIFVNDAIRAHKVMVIDEDWQSLWTMSRDSALSLASSKDLDLIQIAYNPQDMVCTAKLWDYWKYVYEKQKDVKDKKKNQKMKWLKEITFRYTIWENDLELKIKKWVELLEDWYTTKYAIKLRWREKIYADKVLIKLKHIEKSLENSWKTQWIKSEPNGYSLLLLPKIK
jgi:translation initiation factor IF-3